MPGCQGYRKPPWRLLVTAATPTQAQKPPAGAQKAPTGQPGASKHRNRAHPPGLQLQRQRLGHLQRHQAGLEQPACRAAQ